MLDTLPAVVSFYLCDPTQKFCCTISDETEKSVSINISPSLLRRWMDANSKTFQWRRLPALMKTRFEFEVNFIMISVLRRVQAHVVCVRIYCALLKFGWSNRKNLQYSNIIIWDTFVIRFITKSESFYKIWHAMPSYNLWPTLKCRLSLQYNAWMKNTVMKRNMVSFVSYIFLHTIVFFFV